MLAIYSYFNDTIMPKDYILWIFKILININSVMLVYVLLVMIFD